MDLDAEFGALSNVEEGNDAGDDSYVAQKPKGVGVGAAEQGDASNFTAFQGTLQVKYIPF